MNRIILFFLYFISTITFAQNKNSLDKIIYAAMDKNAEKLLTNSKAYSVSIGIVKNGKTYTKHYGEIDKAKGNQANNNTFFEIASITKIATGKLMAQAVLEGKLNLDEDIRKYMNGSYPNLEFNNVPIRIKDLVSFKSGLDRELPDNSEIRKNENDSTTFNLKQLDEKYSKKQFFEDLKSVKLDTIPGTKYKYSNLSLELSAYILENVYHKSYETLLYENIFLPLKMNSTKMNLSDGEILANGYNGNHILMPHFSNNLWGSEGYLKSTMADLTKFLSFELDTKNKIVQETQRNISSSDQKWYGYFWDGIVASDYGIICHKHGGAYGTQTLFVVFPELKTGICIVVNISAENTYENLFNSVLAIIDKIKEDSKLKKVIYGYRLSNDNIIFTYKHDKKLDPKLIKNISVVGSFNNWNADNDLYKLSLKSNTIFEVEIPKSKFKKGETYYFKFLINESWWTTTSENAINVDKTEDRNMTFRID